MFRAAVFLAAAFFIAGAVVAEPSIDVDGGQAGAVSLLVEHSFDYGVTFTPRGTLSVHSLRTGSASVDSPPLSDSEKQKLKEICDAGDEGLYLLRFTSSDGKKVVGDGEEEHRTAVRACSLISSGLREDLTVNLDWRNQIVAVSASSGVPVAALGDDPAASSSSSRFRSNVAVKHMEVGPQPDTAAFIQRMEQNLAKERGETKDTPGLIAKYWMYIVPVVLVLAMSGGGSAEGQR